MPSGGLKAPPSKRYWQFPHEFGVSVFSAGEWACNARPFLKEKFGWADSDVLVAWDRKTDKRALF